MTRLVTFFALQRRCASVVILVPARRYRLPNLLSTSSIVHIMTAEAKRVYVLCTHL